LVFLLASPWIDTVTYALGCFPLRTVAFRGHDFSLLALAKGMSTLFAKNGFSRPSLRYCGVFRHVLFPQVFSVGRAFTRSPRSQRSSASNNHHNSALDLYSTVAKQHVSEGNIRRLLEKENRWFGMRGLSTKLAQTCGKANTMRLRSERGHCLSKLLGSLAPRKYTAKRCGKTQAHL